MTAEHFIDKMRFIFDEYFNNEDKMWEYIYDCCMTEFYKNRVWKLKSKMRNEKYARSRKNAMESSDSRK